jgi:hypothetical protein
MTRYLLLLSENKKVSNSFQILIQKQYNEAIVLINIDLTIVLFYFNMIGKKIRDEYHIHLNEKGQKDIVQHANK